MVLTIDLTLTHGGGQQVLLDFVKAVKGADRRVVSLVASGGWIDRSLGEGADRVAVAAPARASTSLFWRTVRLARLSWLLFRHRALFGRADLIVVNDPELFLPSALLAALMRKEAALYLHMAYKGLAGSLLRFVAAFPSVTRLVCVSHFVREHTQQLITEPARKKLVVIENALPHGYENASDEVRLGDTSRIAIVGRLVPEKGQDVVCVLSRRLPASEFYLVGPFENSDAGYVERIRGQSAGNVKLVGYQRPIVSYLKEMGVGILLVPSRIAEASSLASMEGVAAGCAVIARNLGGLGEVARKLGLIMVENDEQFYDSIRRLQEMDRESLRAYVEAASRLARIHFHPLRFERDVREAFGWR
jgi:glycosyltransferase involved in cell wall biosynthesis